MMSELLNFDGAGVRLVAERFDPAGNSRGIVLFLHGGGQTRHSWGRAAAGMAEDGWTAITLDLRGHGDSEWAADGDYGVDAFVRDLLRVTVALPEKPVLIGASLGGVTSLVAAGEHPGTARGLVLVDIAPRAEPQGIKRIQEFMTANLGGFATLDDVADAIQAYTPHRRRPRNLDGLKKNVRLRDDGRWYWHWDPAFRRIGDEPTRRVHESRLQSAARGVTVPTMLVRGSESDVVSPEGVQELLELVPTARVVEAKAGHMVAGDDNAVFVEQLGEFLASV